MKLNLKRKIFKFLNVLTTSQSILQLRPSKFFNLGLNNIEGFTLFVKVFFTLGLNNIESFTLFVKVSVLQLHLALTFKLWRVIALQLLCLSSKTRRH